MKGDEDKQKVVSKHIVMAYSGEPGALGLQVRRTRRPLTAALQVIRSSSLNTSSGTFGCTG